MITHPRSSEWLALIDAAQLWQEAYSTMLHFEGHDYPPAKVAAVQAEEQRLYDAWQHALVAFERADNARRYPI